MISLASSNIWNSSGVLVVQNLFSPDECSKYIEHYMRLREGTYPDDITGDLTSKYPRLLNMHLWDALSMDFMFDNRITNVIHKLIGDFFALQTMVYFKPAGAKGQAWHQDSYYFKTSSIAAWLALDDATEENGCLFVVDGRLEMLPVVTAGEDSFTSVCVEVPFGKTPRPLIMNRGDVAFFDGSVIHGSFRNQSSGFRRSLIAHYAPDNIDNIAKGYNPIFNFSKNKIQLKEI